MITDKNNWIAVLTILIIVMGITITVMVAENLRNSSDEITVPKYAGVFFSLEEPIAVVVFDLNDPEQELIARQLTDFFKIKYQNLNIGG